MISEVVLIDLLGEEEQPSVPTAPSSSMTPSRITGSFPLHTLSCNQCIELLEAQGFHSIRTALSVLNLTGEDLAYVDSLEDLLEINTGLLRIQLRRLLVKLGEWRSRGVSFHDFFPNNGQSEVEEEEQEEEPQRRNKGGRPRKDSQTERKATVIEMKRNKNPQRKRDRQKKHDIKTVKKTKKQRVDPFPHNSRIEFIQSRNLDMIPKRNIGRPSKQESRNPLLVNNPIINHSESQVLPTMSIPKAFPSPKSNPNTSTTLSDLPHNKYFQMQNRLEKKELCARNILDDFRSTHFSEIITLLHGVTDSSPDHTILNVLNEVNEALSLFRKCLGKSYSKEYLTVDILKPLIVIAKHPFRLIDAIKTMESIVKSKWSIVDLNTLNDIIGLWNSDAGDIAQKLSLGDLLSWTAMRAADNFLSQPLHALPKEFMRRGLEGLRENTQKMDYEFFIFKSWIDPFLNTFISYVQKRSKLIGMISIEFENELNVVFESYGEVLLQYLDYNIQPKLSKKIEMWTAVVEVFKTLQILRTPSIEKMQSVFKHLIDFFHQAPAQIPMTTHEEVNLLMNLLRLIQSMFASKYEHLSQYTNELLNALKPLSSHQEMLFEILSILYISTVGFKKASFINNQIIDINFWISSMCAVPSQAWTERFVCESWKVLDAMQPLFTPLHSEICTQYFEKYLQYALDKPFLLTKVVGALKSLGCNIPTETRWSVIQNTEIIKRIVRVILKQEKFAKEYQYVLHAWLGLKPNCTKLHRYKALLQVLNVNMSTNVLSYLWKCISAETDVSMLLPHQDEETWKLLLALTEKYIGVEYPCRIFSNILYSIAQHVDAANKVKELFGGCDSLSSIVTAFSLKLPPTAVEKHPRSLIRLMLIFEKTDISNNSFHAVEVCGWLLKIMTNKVYHSMELLQEASTLFEIVSNKLSLHETKVLADASLKELIDKFLSNAVEDTTILSSALSILYFFSSFTIIHPLLIANEVPMKVLRRLILFQNHPEFMEVIVDIVLNMKTSFSKDDKEAIVVLVNDLLSRQYPQSVQDHLQSIWNALQTLTTEI